MLKESKEEKRQAAEDYFNNIVKPKIHCFSQTPILEDLFKSEFVLCFLAGELRGINPKAYKNFMNEEMNER